MKKEEYTSIGNPVVLDFTHCKTFNDMYDIISVPFDFPEFFGKNPDALWDCMRDYCEKGTRVIVKGSKNIHEDLKDEFELIIRVFNRLHKETPNITFEII